MSYRQFWSKFFSGHTFSRLAKRQGLRTTRRLVGERLEARFCLSAVFDAVTDFSNSANTESSTWSYRHSYETNTDGTTSRDGTYDLLGTNSALFPWWSPPTSYWNTGVHDTSTGVGVNRSGSPIASEQGPFSWPNNTIFISPSRLAAVSWLSPVAGTVDIEFSFKEMQPGGGDGIKYFVDRNDSSGQLTGGTLSDLGATGLLTLNDISVVIGDRINFVVDMNATNAFDCVAVTARILPANEPPTATAGGPYTVAEGSNVTLTASGSDSDGDPMSFAWDLDNNGTFETNGQSVLFSAAGRDGPDSQTVVLQVSDNHGASTTSTAIVGINNAAPTATDNSYSTVQATTVSGNVITDDTGAGVDSDPAGTNDSLTVGGHSNPSNGTLAINPDGSFSYTPDSTFAGFDSFTYTISDGDGGLATATVTINVTAAVQASILNIQDTCLGGTALLITGTSAGDTMVVEPGATTTTLNVTLNGVTSTVARPSGRIIVTGGAGDDNIQIAGAVSNPVWLYGDAGNDRLNAGSGGGLLIGGDGNDQLLGGNGRDVMIGGQGSDKLVGNANGDILIAGWTTKDNRSSTDHENFWCGVLAEWSSAGSFSTRVNNLRGINSSYTGPKLLPEVLDDLYADEIDFLNGNSGDDWLIFLAGDDKVVGKSEASN